MTRKVLGTMLLVAAMAAPWQLARADQTDPRLPELFDALKQADSRAVSSDIERQIWTLWLQPDEDSAEALLEAGVAAMRRRDLHEALATFDALVVRLPEFAEGWNKRATVHYLLNNLDESLADIDRTLQLEPRHFGAISGRGMVFMKKRDLPAALKAFEEAAEVGPMLPGVNDNIEALREALGVREI